jgi:hypothetical protein
MVESNSRVSSTTKSLRIPRDVTKSHFQTPDINHRLAMIQAEVGYSRQTGNFVTSTGISFHVSLDLSLLTLPCERA